MQMVKALKQHYLGGDEQCDMLGKDGEVEGAPVGLSRGEEPGSVAPLVRIRIHATFTAINNLVSIFY